MIGRDRCNGPGHKEIFETRRDAQDELRRRKEGRRARPGQGGVHACSWAAGQHYHITSHKRPGKGR